MMDWLDPRLLAPGADLEWLATRLADGLRMGRHRALRRGRGIEFAQHRSYSQGDDVRLIDWRAFGRTERLVIREAEVEADHRFWLIVDTSGSMQAGSLEHDRSKFDAARALAAGMAAAAERQGDDYGLLLLGREQPVALVPGRGRAWLSRFLARLDHAQPTGALDEAAADAAALALRASRRSGEAMILSDAYQGRDELERLAGELAAQGWSTRLLCLETDWERRGALPAVRELRDAETGASLLSGPRGAAAFGRRRSDYLEGLGERLRRLGARLDRFSIDLPWDRQLAALLANR